MREIIIAVAAPGGGKDWTYENYFKSTHLKISADDFFMASGEYLFDPNNLPVAHGNCKNKCIEAMKLGMNIYVSNTNTRHRERMSYINLAHEHSYNVKILVLGKSKFKNVHNVPDDKVSEMQNRIDLEPGLYGYSSHKGYIYLKSVEEFLEERKNKHERS